jgi:ankyrin repeat protein
MIASGRGHAAMVAFLLERGADAGAVDSSGRTAADLAPDDATRAAFGP